MISGSNPLGGIMNEDLINFYVENLRFKILDFAGIYRSKQKLPSPEDGYIYMPVFEISENAVFSVKANSPEWTRKVREFIVFYANRGELDFICFDGRLVSPEKRKLRNNQVE